MKQEYDSFLEMYLDLIRNNVMVDEMEIKDDEKVPIYSDDSNTIADNGI